MFQFAPESEDVQMFPLVTVAASLVPSLDDTMPFQFCVPSPTRRSFQLQLFAPESESVQMFPPETIAASLVPSLDDAMPYQFRVLTLFVHVSPEFEDVQRYP